jgi:hypothetical protein
MDMPIMGDIGPPGGPWNVRKVLKKHYGPDDLVSVQSQTNYSDNDLEEIRYRDWVQDRLFESMDPIGSLPAVTWTLTHEMVDLQVQDNKRTGNLWMELDYVDGSLYAEDTVVNIPPKTHTRAKPKTYKRNKKLG